MSHPQTDREREEAEKVYADLVGIYPENESYLRQYAEILLESGKASTATLALKQLHALLEKRAPEKASALAYEFPQIGRITRDEVERLDDTELGEMFRKMLGVLWIKLHQKRLEEGHKLYTRGEEGDSLALIIKGEMAVCITRKNHPTILLNLIGANDVVGEACFFNPGKRNADIVANRDSIVVEIPRKKLSSFLTGNRDAQQLLEEKADFRQMTNVLSNSELLQNIPLDMRKYLADTAKTTHYQQGALIRQSGEEMESVDMLIRGEAHYMMRSREGEHVKLGTFKVSELLGDVSALRKASCPTDIVAASEVLMSHIPLSSFTNVVEAYPPFKEKLLQHAQERREEIMRMIMRFGESEKRHDSG